MHIYRADLKDLSACLELDGSYETDRVWQVLQQEDESEVVARFRVSALPRTMYVRYPSWSEALLSHQERGDLILVAAVSTELRGYIDVEAQPDQGIAWLHHLIVTPHHRREGVGSALLARGLQYAHQNSLSSMMVVVQSKNFPAISFLQKQGFKFCGYNERFYRNQDIALYFGRGL